MATDPQAHDDLPFRDDEPDPIVEECLRDALAPYLGALTPSQIDCYRALLTVFIKTHPAAAPLYQRLRKRKPVEASSDVPRDRAATSERRLDGTQNGRRK